MYGSVTDAPRRAKSHGYITERYYKGEGRWISDDTPKYITERVLYYTDADAIAEGLADLDEEREEQAYLDCEAFDWMEANILEMPESDYERRLAEAYNSVLDAMFDEDMDVYADMFEEPMYDCDGPGMCHICTPGLIDD